MRKLLTNTSSAADADASQRIRKDCGPWARARQRCLAYGPRPAGFGSPNLDETATIPGRPQSSGGERPKEGSGGTEAALGSTDRGPLWAAASRSFSSLTGLDFAFSLNFSGYARFAWLPLRCLRLGAWLRLFRFCFAAFLLTVRLASGLLRFLVFAGSHETSRGLPERDRRAPCFCRPGVAPGAGAEASAPVGWRSVVDNQNRVA
jgi:hypothetical protein